MGKTKKTSPKKIILLVFFALILLGLLFSSLLLLDIYNEINGNSLSAGEFYTVEIKSGDTTSKISKELEESGIIKYSMVFEFIAKSEGMDKKMQIGSFSLEKGVSYNNIFEALQQVQEYRKSVRVTIPEGYEVNEIIDTLVEKGIGEKERYLQIISAWDFGYEYIPEANTKNRLEGFLYPDTYDIFIDELEENVLQKFIDNFDSKIKAEDILNKAKEVGMTLNDTLTLASIIEMEGQAAEELPMISSVFHNRIKISMNLQSCATVNYILPVAERKWILTYKDMAIDNPYNTYKYPGLPPTPISNPGIVAIKAAIAPAESEYLYFVAKGDETGTHAFSKTLAEHEANADKYLRQDD
ncbi:MAG: hypothetical protein K0S55_1479 [Clostridia bacterium]|nr:hypothetical protein [Clostridia bacterium]